MIDLPEKAAQTSAEHPWPVRVLSLKLAAFIEKMSVTWVEGQIVQLNRRPGARTAYLTLRDPEVDISLACSIQTSALDAMDAATGPVRPGARVVVQIKPAFFSQRGSLVMDVRQIRPVGIGELLARVELLKRQLAAEGLFASQRKRTLPFLPHTVGLVCGRGSAAERDVVNIAQRRWPGTRFVICHVAVQGRDAVPEVTAALLQLDDDPNVEVVVIARGGGSVEDLLPFSNEALLRVVSRMHTPVVSAIGHEQDVPLLDLVADLRAATPTDAAKLIVPDAAEQAQQLLTVTQRARQAISRRLADESALLNAHTSRPVMANPDAYLRLQGETLGMIHARALRCLVALFGQERQAAAHLAQQARTLAPVSTLERGYAIVSTAADQIVMDPAGLALDEQLRVQVARGDFAVRTLAAATKP